MAIIRAQVDVYQGSPSMTCSLLVSIRVLLIPNLGMELHVYALYLTLILSA